MPIPDYQSIMLPLLQFSSDGREQYVTEAIENLAVRFDLSNIFLMQFDEFIEETGQAVGRSGNGGIDGIKLASLMIDHNVGVTPVTTYEIKRIDSDYFLEE